MCIVCSCLIVFTKVIAKLLFANQFYSAWIYSPFLTTAVIFGTMSGVIGGVFSAVKDSKMFAVSTCMGAAVNVCLNIVLVKAAGAVGAAAATLVSSAVVWAMRLYHSRRYITLKLNLGRDSAAYVILIFFVEGTVLYGYELLLLTVVILLFRKETANVFRQIIQWIGGSGNVARG